MRNRIEWRGFSGLVGAVDAVWTGFHEHWHYDWRFGLALPQFVRRLGAGLRGRLGQREYIVHGDTGLGHARSGRRLNLFAGSLSAGSHGAGYAEARIQSVDDALGSATKWVLIKMQGEYTQL